MAIAFTVNGEAKRVEASETATLLDVLRNHLGLMGTRYGCGLEQCGSCMVLVDGQPVLRLHPRGRHGGRPQGHDHRRAWARRPSRIPCSRPSSTSRPASAAIA